MFDFSAAYPSSRKVYVDGGQDVRVPMREISLAGGETPLRVYDTSGPHGHDVEHGLPKLREPWVSARLKPARSMSDATARADRTAKASDPERSAPALAKRCVTQLHYARKGEITPEMEFVAVREALPADFVRDEIARGLSLIHI